MIFFPALFASKTKFHRILGLFHYLRSTINSGTRHWESSERENETNADGKKEAATPPCLKCFVDSHPSGRRVRWEGVTEIFLSQLLVIFQKTTCFRYQQKENNDVAIFRNFELKISHLVSILRTFCGAAISHSHRSIEATNQSQKKSQPTWKNG